MADKTEHTGLFESNFKSFVKENSEEDTQCQLGFNRGPLLPLQLKNNRGPWTDQVGDTENPKTKLPSPPSGQQRFFSEMAPLLRADRRRQARRAHSSPGGDGPAGPCSRNPILSIRVKLEPGSLHPPRPPGAPWAPVALFFHKQLELPLQQFSI